MKCILAWFKLLTQGGGKFLVTCTRTPTPYLSYHPHTQSCTSVIFFEVRKKQDLYLWLAKSPAGPSVKFLVQNGGCYAKRMGRGLHEWGVACMGCCWSGAAE